MRSELDPPLGLDALLFVGMLDRSNLADQIGDLDQFGWRMAAGHHDVQHGSSGAQRIEHRCEIQVTAGFNLAA